MTGKKVPSDLSIIIGLVLLTDIVVLTPGLNESIVRNLLGLPLVIFLPGYSLLSALFPAKSDLGGIERISLSFGLSIAVVPLIGIGLTYTSWGIGLLPVLISLSLFTFFMCGLAYQRRSKLPENEAFEVPFKDIAFSIKAEFLKKPESKLDKAINVFLVCSILLSVSTIVYMLLTPKEGEHFTEFYILGPEGKAGNYTSKYFLGESDNITVGIVNHEYRAVNYTLEMKLENKSIPLPANLQFITVANNETWIKSVKFIPPFTGKNMKLEFLLFNDTDQSASYRNLHLWIDVY